MAGFHVVVPGVPVSVQGSSALKQRWKAKVNQTAAALGPSITSFTPLRMSLVFFHTGATNLDTDNIIKPIQDSLVGVVYVDDRQVTDVFAARRDLTTSYRLRTTPPALTRALAQVPNFVFIAVEEISYGDPLL